MHNKTLDIIGKKFGKLTAIEVVGSNKKSTQIKCRCECGEYRICDANKLKSGIIKYCSFKNHKTPKVDLVGKRFNKLTVIRLAGQRKIGKENRYVWECLCDCGEVGIFSSNALQSGHVVSCGNHHKRPIGEASWTAYMNTYKCHGHDFNLSIDVFKILASSPCHYCGIGPNKIFPTKNIYNGQILVNGIDRIDSNFGYIAENCVPCCTTCNHGKNSLDIDDWNSWINRLVNFQNERKGNLLIFLDMDGVIADFCRRAAILFNRDIDDMYHSWTPMNDMYKELKISKSQFWSTIQKDKNFWEALQPYDHLNDLLNILRGYTVKILTSPSSDINCPSGKKAWLHRYVPHLESTAIIAKDKFLLAGKGRILIDDTDDKILSWNEASPEAYSITFPQPWNKNYEHRFSKLEFVKRELDRIKEEYNKNV